MCTTNLEASTTSLQEIESLSGPIRMVKQFFAAFEKKIQRPAIMNVFSIGNWHVFHCPHSTCLLRHQGRPLHSFFFST